MVPIYPPSDSQVFIHLYLFFFCKPTPNSPIRSILLKNAKVGSPDELEPFEELTEDDSSDAGPFGEDVDVAQDEDDDGHRLLFLTEIGFNKHGT